MVRRGKSQIRGKQRRGAILVLAAILLVVMVGMIALSVDLGAIFLARTQAQVSADAGALAGCWALLSKASEADNPWDAEAVGNANRVAQSHVFSNVVFGKNPRVTLNLSNETDGDIVLGQFYNGTFVSGGPPAEYNAIRVRVDRNSTDNGEVPLFFAPVFGWRSIPVSAEATASLTTKVIGFRLHDDEPTMPILPITVAEGTWDEFNESSSVNDDWAWDETTQSVTQGSDSVPEMQLYPSSTDASGNLGTVNIGTSSNSTSNIGRQIVDGINSADFAFHGGELKMDGSGTLELSGDPGLSAAIGASLEQIIGQTRVIPVYRSVTGTGNGANFEIVRWVGIRVMSLDLGGNNKVVFVQPANVVTKGAIGGTTDSSRHVFSPPLLSQ